MDSPTILVVDDEKKILEVVSAYLKREGFQVVTASDGPSALASLAASQPSLVVLDLLLPGLSGEKVCQQIRQSSSVPVLMLTAKSQEEERLAGFALGADDYLTKPFSPRELIARIKAILKRVQIERGEDSPSLLVLESGALLIDCEKCLVTRDGISIPLTSTEFKILILLAKNPGRVFSRGEILDRVQGLDSLETEERTVDVHVKNLRRKLQDDPRSPSLIITVFGMGYKFQDGPP